MPTIPIYRQQTEVNALPSMGRVDPSAAAAPAAAVGRVAQQLSQWGEERRQEFDALRTEEAFNQLRERQMALMLDPEKGFSSVKSRDAVQRPLVKEYSEFFQQAQNEIAATLQSENQRKRFQQRAAGAGLEFRNALMRHVLQESNQYAQEVYQGTLTVESDRAIKEWNNPYTIQSSLDRIDAAVAQRAKREGLAADATDALLKDARSKVHTSVLKAALDAGNVGYAEKYLDLNGHQMNAHDSLAVRGMVRKEADTRFALGAATEAVQSFQNQANPDDFMRLASLVEARESGGKQDAVSPKGARGLMQLMPATARELESKLGMKPGQTDIDPESNRRAGQAYLAELLHTFKGDLAMSLAAYNAGPGRVQAELKEHGPSGWLDAMPKETRDYVAAIVPQYTAGKSAIARPTLEQVQQSVRAKVGDSNPERLQLALTEAGRQWKASEDARKQRADEAVGEAFKALEANGGRWDSLPPSLKSEVPGDKLGALRDFAAKVSKGEPVETDLDVYYTLRTNPATLQAANLLAFKNKLSDADFKELARQQEDARAGSASQTQVQTVQQRMNMRLNEMGVDPSPKTGGTDSRKVAQVWVLLDQRVRAAEAAAGRRLKPEEMDAQIDGLFSTVEVKGALWGTSTRRAFELQPSDQIVVPDSDRQQIMSALKNAGQPVTEERVLYYYRRARGLL